MNHMGLIALDYATDRRRVYSFKPCEECDGKGFKSYPSPKAFMMEEGRTMIIDFGVIIRCRSCQGSGQICSHYYTRGVSLTPIIQRKGKR